MKCLVISALTCALVTTAGAADLGRRPISHPPVMDWSGFYVGANVGYGIASVGDTNTSDHISGAIGGGQFGYNWQSGNLLLGVEADFQGSSQKRSDITTIGGTAFTVDQKLPWFATARGRLGYANGPWLLYATGGAAWVNYKLSVSALGATVSDDTTKVALVAGAGIEYMLAQRWSANLEYLYIDTGNTDVTLFGTTFSARAKDNIIRAGLNYHF